MTGPKHVLAPGLVGEVLAAGRIEPQMQGARQTERLHARVRHPLPARAVVEVHELVDAPDRQARRQSGVDLRDGGIAVEDEQHGPVDSVVLLEPDLDSISDGAEAASAWKPDGKAVAVASSE